MSADHRLRVSDPGARRGWAAFAPLVIGPVVVVIAAAAATGWTQRQTEAELAVAAALRQRLDRDQVVSARPLEVPLRWLTALAGWLPDGVSLRRAEQHHAQLELEGDATTIDALEVLRQRLQATPWVAVVETAEIRSVIVDAPAHRFVLRVRLGAVAAPESR